jgi:hypothetical protein
VRAPATPGTFLRTFTFGHVRQLDAVRALFVRAWPRTPDRRARRGGDVPGHR